MRIEELLGKNAGEMPTVEETFTREGTKFIMVKVPVDEMVLKELGRETFLRTMRAVLGGGEQSFSEQNSVLEIMGMVVTTQVMRVVNEAGGWEKVPEGREGVREEFPSEIEMEVKK